MADRNRKASKDHARTLMILKQKVVKAFRMLK